MPKCRTVDMSFLDSARIKEVNEIEIDATPEEIFAVFEDPDSWPRWFFGIRKVVWTSPRPFGVGTTRTVTAGPMTMDERFIVWEDNREFAFYFTETSGPFVKALLEDYKLEKIDDNRTRFTYIVAYDPGFLLGLLGPLGRGILSRNFRNATKSLARYMKKSKASR